MRRIKRLLERLTKKVVGCNETNNDVAPPLDGQTSLAPEGRPITRLDHPGGVIRVQPVDPDFMPTFNPRTPRRPKIIRRDKAGEVDK